MAFTEPGPEDPNTRLGIGGWLVLAALIAMLGGALYIAYDTWSAFEGTGMSPLGWTFLILGVVVSILVGAGLMGLVFYSARKNYDR
jgi:hypothetical protein